MQIIETSSLPMSSIQELGEGTSPIFAELENRLKNSTELNVLDMGCRMPWLLIKLNCYFNCKSLVGLDIKSLEEIYEQYKEWHKIDEPINSINDAVRLFGKAQTGFEKNIHWKMDFVDKFTFEKNNVVDYMENLKEGFDLLVASNLLHLKEIELDNTIRSISSYLKGRKSFFFANANADNLIHNGRYDTFIELLSKNFPSGLLIIDEYSSMPNKLYFFNDRSVVNKNLFTYSVAE